MFILRGFGEPLVTLTAVCTGTLKENSTGGRTISLQGIEDRAALQEVALDEGTAELQDARARGLHGHGESCVCRIVEQQEYAIQRAFAGTSR